MKKKNSVAYESVKDECERVDKMYGEERERERERERVQCNVRY